MAGRASTPAPPSAVTPTLAFTGRAIKDIIDAFEWYELQRSGLGAPFLLALARTCELIMHMPSAGPVVHDDVRRLLLRAFPFAIYYRIEADRIVIRGCLHQRQHLQSWRQRP